MTTPDLDSLSARLRFLRAVPHVRGARDLGLATAPIEPWPHQLRVVRTVTASYPRSALFGDEVGLGKTIEAALALRQLLLDGRVRRALVLTPRAVLRQWQEELWEKAALDVPRFDGQVLRDRRGRIVPTDGSPWNHAPVLLVSSHLVRRTERQKELLAADPWDLVILDEAHHARRRSSSAEVFRPNRLLRLLVGERGEPGLAARTRCLYLLSATPMQVHPIELWDLLRVLGMGGRWGAEPSGYLRFFTELGRSLDDRDWAFLTAMVRDHVRLSETTLDETLCAQAEAHLGSERWQRLRAMLDVGATTSLVARSRSASAPDTESLRVLDRMVRRHTPLALFIERNSRAVLDEYRRRGWLDAGVPRRRVETVWIEMRPDERRLYERIDAYLAEVYQRWHRGRPGLGFLVSIYRRRLTSSFAAMRASLERRRLRLAGDTDDVLDADDSVLDSPVLADREQRALDHELAELDDFLRQLETLTTESKRQRLLDDLRQLLAERDRVIVFTQYFDTLEALADVVAAEHGSFVARYSGRGAEIFDGTAWQPTTKTALREAFASGQIRVLLATDAASEGLNLQTCGVLINLDMPWNPMRVEQRIGRIDRIGQSYEEVWIRNYLYEDTVEATIYRRLGTRIAWFEEVVGALRPILENVEERIRDAALTPRESRGRAIDAVVETVATAIAEDDHDRIALDDLFEADVVDQPPPTAPVSQAQLEALLTDNPITGPYFTPVGDAPGIWRLDLCQLGGQAYASRTVTFDPTIFASDPDGVELLTWGHPAFDGLLDTVESELAPRDDEPRGIGLYASEQPPTMVVMAPDGQGRPRPIEDLAALDAVLADPVGAWTAHTEAEASRLFSRRRQDMRAAAEQVQRTRRHAEGAALRHAARDILIDAALVAQARGAAQAGLFGDEAVGFGEAVAFGKAIAFGEEAVLALARGGSPFPELLELVGRPPAATREHPSWARLASAGPAQLERRARRLVERGKRLLDQRRAHDGAAPSRERVHIMRGWWPLTPHDDAPLPFDEVDTLRVQPFVNAIPLWDDLAEPAWRLDEEDLGDLAWDRHGLRWASVDGHVRPATFVARVGDTALEHRIPAGAWAVFRSHIGQVRTGSVVLARHHRLDELGGPFALRVLDHERRGGKRRGRKRLVLRTDDPAQRPLVLDPQRDDLKILAELVEVL
ncbi:MAG: helicase-related protein [Acidobacteriota bacterium]